MKVGNIQKDVETAKRFSFLHGTPWQKFIDWRSYQRLGYTHVEFNGVTYEYNGLGPTITVELKAS